MAIPGDARDANARTTATDSPTHSGDEFSNNEKANQPSHVEKAAETRGAGITYTDGVDPEKERKMLRKIDAYVIPWVCLLYLSSFLDRYVCVSLRFNVP